MMDKGDFPLLRTTEFVDVKNFPDSLASLFGNRFLEENTCDR